MPFTENRGQEQNNGFEYPIPYFFILNQILLTYTSGEVHSL